MTIDNSRSRILLALLGAGATIAISTAASNYIVRGVVKDATDNTPCSGAIVRFYAENDSVLPIVSNIADSLGRFEQSLDSAGSYRLRAEFLGMDNHDITFRLDGQKRELTLEPIGMKQSSAMLDELVVSVRKPLIENDGATLTYNMTEDPMAQGNSVLEMLRKVPMVTVDAEENIKVKGRSNFKIYLNGREDPMLSGDPKTILKSMPASTIKKIEVITEPGAKYDAEGTEGILNIVTVTKQNLEGVVGNLSAWMNSGSAGASAYARTKIGNVTGSANVSYNHSIFPSLRRYTSGEEIENMLSEDDRKNCTAGSGKNNYSYAGGGFNLSWEPDTLNLYTIEANIGKNNSISRNLQQMWGENSHGVEQWRLEREWDSLWEGLWTSATASYQHNFKKEGHHIVGSYQYSFNQGENNSDMKNRNLLGGMADYPWRRNEGRNHSNMHTLQIDYANPLGSHNTLEAGFKSVWNRNNNMSAPWYGTTEEDMAVREEERVSMAQFKNIQAVYLSHTGNYGKWNTRAGLRYEFTKTGIDYFSPGYENFSSRFNDWVPNLSVAYRLNGMQTIRLGYQMRISRPGLYCLNPYVNTMTVGQISYGNPTLESEKNNAVSLSYSNYGGAVGGSVKLEYSHTGNKIENYSFAKGNLIHYTYGNIGRYQDASVSGNLQWTIIQNMTLSLYGYLSYDDYKGDSELLNRRAHSWYWNYNVNFDYRFPCKISLSAYGGQGSAWKNLESKGEGWYYYGLSVSRTFLKDDKLRVQLYGQSFLPTHRMYHNSTIGENAASNSWYRTPQWYAGISVSWQFGKLNADVKRTEASIQAESEAGGGNGNKGGR